MFKTGATQRIFGMWHTEQQAWLRDGTGSVALYGEEQAKNWFGTDKAYVIKELFICSEEELTDTRLPALQAKWAARR